MSSPVAPFPSLTSPALSGQSPLLSLESIPPELAQLPAGTVLPAVLIPPATPRDSSVLQLTLPDGTQQNIPVKTSRPVLTETPVSVKIVSTDAAKAALSVRLHFSAPLPDIKAAATALEAAVKTAPAEEVRLTGILHTEGFVLRSVPEQILNLIPDLIGAEQTEKPLPPEMKVGLEIRPDDRLPPVKSEITDIRPAVSENAERAPLPAQPQKETVTFIELPKDSPAPDAVKESSVSPQRTIEQTGTVTATISADSFTATEALARTADTNLQISAMLLTQEKPAEKIVLSTKESPVAPPTGKTASFVPVDRTEKTPLSAVPQKSADDRTTTTETTATRPETTEKKVQTASAVYEHAEKAIVAARNESRGIVFAPKDSASPLIALKNGVIALAEKIHLPHLTPVLVKLTPLSVSENQPVDADFPVSAFKNTWTTLTRTLETLSRTDPQTFETLKAALPQISSPKMPALIMTFITTATNGAPLTAWLGENNVSALKASGETGQKSLQRLEKEFAANPKKATDGTNTWKGWDIPLLSGAVVEPVSLYLQRPSDDDGAKRHTGKKNADNVRFVLDLNLTRIGKMQLEGLARRQNRMFDLIIRHERELPDVFESEVRTVFSKTLDALNYAGTVAVNHTDDFIDFSPLEAGESVKTGVWA